MASLLGLFKKIFFWNYARNTWQWDALCVVILIFIFLTPKSWFGTGELPAASGHQMTTTSTLFFGTEVIETQRDRAQLEERVRVMTGRQDAKVVEVRKRLDQDGRPIGYEVDIR